MGLSNIIIVYVFYNKEDGKTFLAVKLQIYYPKIPDIFKKKITLKKSNYQNNRHAQKLYFCYSKVVNVSMKNSSMMLFLINAP